MMDKVRKPSDSDWNFLFFVEFKALTAVPMNHVFFQVVTPCSPVVHWRFRGMFWLHFMQATSKKKCAALLV
jgi:hypothetical protein